MAGCSACRKVEASKTQMVKNLMHAGGNAIKAYVSGKPVFSNTQMVMQRVDICKNCPDNKYIADQDRCMVCGCFIQKSILGNIAKATLATESCPNGHW